MLSTMPKTPQIKQISSKRLDYCRSKCALRDGYAEGMGLPVPVEYAVAVDQYLEQAALTSASRRVYRISLASWAWPLVGKPVPRGTERRGAVPPVVPLALLDEPATGERLDAQFTARTAMADAHTANRELSALRSAAGWWREQDWICSDPTAGLRHQHPDPLGARLSEEQVGALFLLPVSLREHAL
jgi:integrase/recombinase XerD